MIAYVGARESKVRKRPADHTGALYLTGMTTEPNALQLLQRMFDVELRFMRDPDADHSILAQAFHPDVIIREPASLPYAGEWVGFDGLARLFGRMREVWSDLRVEDMQAAQQDQTVYMTCSLHLTARATGATVVQPFAEVLRFRDQRLLHGVPFYFDTCELLAALGGALAGAK